MFVKQAPFLFKFVQRINKNKSTEKYNHPTYSRLISASAVNSDRRGRLFFY